MKNIILFLVFLAGSLHTSAQTYRPVYAALKEYEGLYEFTNHTTLKVAASPKDTILYAIVNQSMYPLTPFAKDTFLNMQKDKISFVRNAAHHITGYAMDNNTYKMLNAKLHFPKAMWYPKLAAQDKHFRYSYTAPANIHDGLQTGSIDNSGLDKDLIIEMVNKIDTGVYPNVHSILVIKNGRLVVEEYFYDYSRDSLQELRSASKSFISALTGIAIQQGLIKSKNESVISYFPEYDLANKSEAKKRITVENLLTNQSGLDCDISNGKSEGNETKMDYSDDWVKFTLDLPMTDTPGGKGMYCSGNPITLGRIIEKMSGASLHDYAWKNLFAPLGITNLKWNFKPTKANAEDYCQVYVTPREMAKFGLLYLNGGVWNNKQIVPAEWVKESIMKHSVVQGIDYGYLWWLKYLDAGSTRYHGIAAQGNGGQKIYLFPDQQLVVVVTGGNYNTQSPSDELIRKYILPAFNKK